MLFEGRCHSLVLLSVNGKLSHQPLEYDREIHNPVLKRINLTCIDHKECHTGTAEICLKIVPDLLQIFQRGLPIGIAGCGAERWRYAERRGAACAFGIQQLQFRAWVKLY